MEYGTNVGTPHKDSSVLGLKSPDSGDWRDFASCKTMGIANFFATFSNKNSEAAAGLIRVRTLCNSCEVQQECLDFSIRNEIAYGIWGGLTASERKELFTKVSVTVQRSEFR